MKKALLLLPLIILTFACKRNHAPEIVEVLYPDILVPGYSKVMLTLDMVDPDGDPLTATWTAYDGEFLTDPDDTFVMWKAPISVVDTTFEFNVEVSDGKRVANQTFYVGVAGGRYKDYRDDHVYKFVKIGQQVWMAENLRVIEAVHEPTDWSDTEPRYYSYGYNGTNLTAARSNHYFLQHGALYNWKAATISCHEGWHLPTDAEWTQLTNYLGANEAYKMKSDFGWDNGGNGDNSSGFNALAAGMRWDNNQFLGAGEATAFWTAKDNQGITVWRMLVDNSNSITGDNNLYWGYGFSVRCIKD